MAGKAFKPPQVSGRFFLSSGAIATILHDRRSDAEQTTLASYGHYTLAESEFAYQYDDPAVFVTVKGVTNVSRNAPWSGLRKFAVTREKNAVRFKATSGQEFVFTRDAMTYAEGGAVLRVWRRL